MNKINLAVKMANLDKQIDYFIYNLSTDFWGQEPTAKMLAIDLKSWQEHDETTQFNIVKDKATLIFQEKESEIQKSVSNIQKLWDENQEKIEECFKNVFGEFPNMNCFASSTFNNVIFPRYLDTKCFDFYYGMSDEAFLRVAIHEITHFIWFEKVKKLMPEFSREEYEYPSPVWLFSEIAVDQVFWSQEYFCNIASLTSRPAYGHFYTDKFNDSETVIEHFRKLYSNSKSIDEFIINGTRQCIDWVNEDEKEENLENKK